MLLYPVGEGAGLAPLEPWHADEFLASVADMRRHLAPWIPFAHSITDVDSARAFLRRFADAHAADTRHLFGIWRAGRLIGGVMFPTFDARGGICEIGVWLAPEEQGRGLMTRAVRHLIDWAIRERGMSRVEWHTDPRNSRSRAIAERLGMRYEGVRRSSHVVADERQDAEVWSLLAGEWTGASPLTEGAVMPFFDTTDGCFSTDVQTAVRRQAYGEDIGQSGWLTAVEWRRYLGWAKVGDGCDLLDVGSGSGGPAVRAAVETGCRVVGIDCHEPGVAAATRLAAERGVAERVRFVAADASLRLPFPDDSFDVVTCIDVIHHFSDRAAVLAEWRRILRPGGQVICTDPGVVTGLLTSQEIAVRGSIGFLTFTTAEANERVLAATGLDVVRHDDTTDNVEFVAERWRAARAEYRDDLVALEGRPTYDGRQRFLAMTEALAAQRRLSRYTVHAVA